MNTITIDNYTAAVTQLRMYFNDTFLSTGTAFFWRNRNRTYLVTNWHNLSGINPITEKHISDTAAEPNIIQFDAFRENDLNNRVNVTIAIRREGIPLWLEHPRHGGKVDVACFDITGIDCTVFHINEINSQMLVKSVGQDVFVIGYPLGVHTNGFALWKRATIASEPDIDVDGFPLFYVDTATTKGMSGSPVIIRTNIGATENSPLAMFIDKATMFIGIYSGRLYGAGPMEAQIGRVWKASVVNEIILGGA